MFVPRHNILSNAHADIRTYVVSWLKYSPKRTIIVSTARVHHLNVFHLPSRCRGSQYWVYSCPSSHLCSAPGEERSRSRLASLKVEAPYRGASFLGHFFLRGLILRSWCATFSTGEKCLGDVFFIEARPWDVVVLAFQRVKNCSSFRKVKPVDAYRRASPTRMDVVENLLVYMGLRLHQTRCNAESIWFRAPTLHRLR